MNLSKGNRFQSQQDLFLIQQGCIKMFKSDNIYGTKYLYLEKKNSMLFVLFFFCSSKNPEKTKCHGFHKKAEQHNCFQN